jgi:hypothetical protein
MTIHTSIVTLYLSGCRLCLESMLKNKAQKYTCLEMSNSLLYTEPSPY